MAKKRAKGSAVAAAAQWKLGDLVLAKVKGFPAWPAQVSRAEDFGRQRNPAKVFVVFFGTQQIRFCHHSEISAFTSEARASLHARTLAKCVPSDLRKAVNEICAVADETGGAPASVALNQRPETTISGYRSDEEQTSSNTENRNSRQSLVSDDDESFTQSLESRRGSGSCASRAKDGEFKRKRLGVAPQATAGGGDGGGVSRNDLKEGHGAWELSCTNSCSSFMEKNVEVPQSVPLIDRVLTNFASHEELDSFENDGVLERAEKTCIRESEQQQQQPQKFSWLRQCSRTSTRLRKKCLSFAGINFCQTNISQTTTTTRKLSKTVIHSDSEASSGEGFGDSLDKKPVRNHGVPRLKDGEEVSDKHLPLLKRASARIIHEGSCFKRSSESKREQPKPRRLIKKAFTEETLWSENHSQDSKDVEKRQVPLKAEKYRLRSSLPESEADLPPLKRHHREEPDDVAGVSNLRNSKAVVHRKLVETFRERCLSNQTCETSRAPTAKARKLKKLNSSFRAIDIHSPHHSAMKRKFLKKSSAGELEKKDSLDDLPSAQSSRFYCEDVNRVREAYEAAKEKKQKLASSNKSAPSTSMKYLLAVQSKQAYHPKVSESHREAAMRLNIVEKLKFLLVISKAVLKPRLLRTLWSVCSITCLVQKIVSGELLVKLWIVLGSDPENR